MQDSRPPDGGGDAASAEDVTLAFQLLCSTVESNKMYMTRLEEENEGLQQQLQQWKEAKNEARAAVSHAQTEVDRLQQKLNQRGVETLVLQQEVSQIRQQMQEAEEKAEETLRQQQDEIWQLHQQLREYEKSAKDVETQQQDVARLREQLHDERARAREFEVAADELRDKYHRSWQEQAQLREQLEQQQHRAEQHEKATEELREKYQRMLQRIAACSAVLTVNSGEGAPSDYFAGSLRASEVPTLPHARTPRRQTDNDSVISRTDTIRSFLASHSTAAAAAAPGGRAGEPWRSSYAAKDGHAVDSPRTAAAAAVSSGRPSESWRSSYAATEPHHTTAATAAVPSGTWRSSYAAESHVGETPAVPPPPAAAAAAAGARTPDAWRSSYAATEGEAPGAAPVAPYSVNGDLLTRPIGDLLTRPIGDLGRHIQIPSRRTSRSSLKSFRLSPTQFGVNGAPETFSDAASTPRPASADLETAWGRMQQQQQQQQSSDSVVASISKSALDSFHSTHSLRDFGGSSVKSYGNSDRRGSVASGVSSRSAWTIGAARYPQALADAPSVREYSRTYINADDVKTRGNLGGNVAAAAAAAAQPDSKSTFGGSSTGMFGSAPSDTTETASKAAVRGGITGYIRSMWRGRA